MRPKLTSHYSQVVAPSTSKNTPVHHVAIPLLRSVNVRPLPPPSQLLSEKHPTLHELPTNLHSTHHRQLGYESQEKKDYGYRSDAIYERRSEEIQERVPDWGAEGSEGCQFEFVIGKGRGMSRLGKYDSMSAGKKILLSCCLVIVARSKS